MQGEGRVRSLSVERTNRPLKWLVHRRARRRSAIEEHVAARGEALE
jgi:hypothetical protein